jgi:intein-encoded DNA endonuclease-like protein
MQETRNGLYAKGTAVHYAQKLAVITTKIQAKVTGSCRIIKDKTSITKQNTSINTEKPKKWRTNWRKRLVPTAANIIITT